MATVVTGGLDWLAPLEFPAGAWVVWAELCFGPKARESCRYFMVQLALVVGSSCRLGAVVGARGGAGRATGTPGGLQWAARWLAGDTASWKEGQKMGSMAAARACNLTSAAGSPVCCWPWSCDFEWGYFDPVGGEIGS